MKIYDSPKARYIAPGTDEWYEAVETALENIGKQSAETHNDFVLHKWKMEDEIKSLKWGIVALNLSLFVVALIVGQRLRKLEEVKDD